MTAVKRPRTCASGPVIPMRYSQHGLERCPCPLCKRAWAAHDKAVARLRDALDTADAVCFLDPTNRFDAVDLAMVFLGGEPSFGGALFHERSRKPLSRY